MTTGRDEGQAAVELALVLPMVTLLLLAVVQIALVARDQILVVHAAREGDRAAAVGPGVVAVRQAVLGSGSLEARRLELVLSDQPGPARRVVVSVSYRSPTSLALVGSLLPDVTLRSKATMRAETPGSR